MLVSSAKDTNRQLPDRNCCCHRCFRRYRWSSMAHDRTNRLPTKATRRSRTVGRARYLIAVGNSLEGISILNLGRAKLPLSRSFPWFRLGRSLALLVLKLLLGTLAPESCCSRQFGGTYTRVTAFSPFSGPVRRREPTEWRDASRSTHPVFTLGGEIS